MLLLLLLLLLLSLLLLLLLLLLTSNTISFLCAHRFTRDINYALTRAICRVSAVEGCGGSSPAYPTHGIVSSSPANKEKPTNDISPRVHVLAFVVINERCVKIGDHIVCDSEKHSLPVFKLSFPRNVLPPLKAPGEVKKPSCVTSSPASRLASMATKRLYPSTPKK